MQWLRPVKIPVQAGCDLPDTLVQELVTCNNRGVLVGATNFSLLQQSLVTQATQDSLHGRVGQILGVAETKYGILDSQVTVSPDQFHQASLSGTHEDSYALGRRVEIET